MQPRDQELTIRVLAKEYAKPVIAFVWSVTKEAMKAENAKEKQRHLQ